MPSRSFSTVAFAAAAFACFVVQVRAADAPVGMTRMSVAGDTASRGDASGKLRVVVWYPAAEGTAMSPIAVGPPRDPFFLEGEAAADAPLAPVPVRLPLVVVSHGTGGTSMDLSWLCASLAAHGYLVASVDHPGNNALDPQTVAGLTLWWARASDLSRVIDGVLASPVFGPRVDRARIGAAGFSLGGYTVLVLGGARGDASRLDAYCARRGTAQVCTGEATPTLPDVAKRAKALAAGDATYREALGANLQSHRDARVRAIFSIAPALGPAIVPESLGSIDVPVALVAGFGDPVLPVGDNAIADALAIPNARLSLLPKPVGHYTFLTACTPEGAKRFAAICEDAAPLRLEVHRETAALARAFFDATLTP